MAQASPDWKRVKMVLRPDQPVLIQCWDHDLVSQDDLIGEIEVDGSSLTIPDRVFDLFNPEIQSKNPDEFVGHKWEEVEEIPAQGKLIRNEALAQALLRCDEFALEDLKRFKASGLTYHSYINVGNRILRPVPCSTEAKIYGKIVARDVYWRMTGLTSEADAGDEVGFWPAWLDAEDVEEEEESAEEEEEGDEDNHLRMNANDVETNPYVLPGIFLVVDAVRSRRHLCARSTQYKYMRALTSGWTNLTEQCFVLVSSISCQGSQVASTFAHPLHQRAGHFLTLLGQEIRFHFCNLP